MSLSVEGSTVDGTSQRNQVKGMHFNNMISPIHFTRHQFCVGLIF